MHPHNTVNALLFVDWRESEISRKPTPFLAACPQKLLHFGPQAHIGAKLHRRPFPRQVLDETKK
eukprot:1667511-Amphidinium_carterae.1